MAKSLLEKAGRIQVPPPRSEATAVGTAERAASVQPPPKPKTAPGTLMGFMANQSEAMRENEALRSQVARFEGAAPTRRIDAREITPSKWANRHESSFDSADFAALKAEIAQSAGNVQPIKVRPLAPALSDPAGGVGPSNGPTASTESSSRAGARYEIVFGHRRHRACLELGLPVLALVEEATEQQLFVQMERENRNRADLSAWEQGMIYAKALDQGLYPSNRQLAASIGRDLGDVGRALSLARLPQAVIDAFASPLDLQFRWAKPLSDLQQSDPDGLLKRARLLAGKKLAGKETMAILLGGEEGVGRSNPQTVEIMQGGALIAVMTANRSGHITVKFATALSADQQVKLRRAIEAL